MTDHRRQPQMGFIYQGKKLVCDFCGTAGARKMNCPHGYCQAYATCASCRTLKRHKLVNDSHSTCKERMEESAAKLAEFKAGGLDLIAEERNNRWDEGTSFWISGEWYSPCCDVFNRTGLKLEHLEVLRSMGHTVTVIQTGRTV